MFPLTRSRHFSGWGALSPRSGLSTGINTGALWVSTYIDLIALTLPDDVRCRHSGLLLQHSQDGAVRLELDRGNPCLGCFRISQSAQKREVDCRRHQVRFHGPTNLDQPRTTRAIWWICSPPAGVLDGNRMQQVSPTRMDDRIRSPITSRRLWS